MPEQRTQLKWLVSKGAMKKKNRMKQNKKQEQNRKKENGQSNTKYGGKYYGFCCDMAGSEPTHSCGVN